MFPCLSLILIWQIVINWIRSVHYLTHFSVLHRNTASSVPIVSSTDIAIMLVSCSHMPIHSLFRLLSLLFISWLPLLVYRGYTSFNALELGEKASRLSHHWDNVVHVGLHSLNLLDNLLVPVVFAYLALNFGKHLTIAYLHLLYLLLQTLELILQVLYLFGVQRRNTPIWPWRGTPLSWLSGAERIQALSINHCILYNKVQIYPFQVQ